MSCVGLGLLQTRGMPVRNSARLSKAKGCIDAFIVSENGSVAMGGLEAQISLLAPTLTVAILRGASAWDLPQHNITAKSVQGALYFRFWSPFLGQFKSDFPLSGVMFKGSI